METDFNIGVIELETYKKPMISSHTSVDGIVPLAAVSLLEVAAAAATLAGVAKGLSSDDFRPERSRALTQRKISMNL